MFVQGNPAVGTTRRVATSTQVEPFEIIGQSAVMRELFRDLKTIGKSDAAVLIEGETGVGKNLVARALHQVGPRAARPLVTLNAANLPEDLFESELFGHVKGAFTGAYGDHKGLARSADGGTLFIDEVGELTLAAQAKLLCFLDRQEVRPVGGIRTINVNLRVVCATNRDLRKQVRRGQFRRDLYYRLRVIALRVPPLRERRDDIPLLVAHFVKRFNKRYRKAIPGLDPQANALLERHNWDGNVRELENEIERAVVLTADQTRILAETFSLDADEALDTTADEELAAKVGGSLLRESRYAAERSIIAKALKRHRWNVSATARELGISRVGLTRKLKRLGLRRPTD